MPFSGTGRPHGQCLLRGVKSAPPQAEPGRRTRRSWPHAGPFLLNSMRRQTAGPERRGRRGCFLAASLAREARKSRLSALGVRANRPHDFVATILLTTDSPLTTARWLLRGSCHPQARAPGEHARAAAWPEPFRHRLIGLEYPGRPGTAWDFHRSVSSAIVSRRRRQSPRVSEGISVSRPPETSCPVLQRV